MSSRQATWVCVFPRCTPVPRSCVTLLTKEPRCRVSKVGRWLERTVFRSGLSAPLSRCFGRMPDPPTAVEGYIGDSSRESSSQSGSVRSQLPADRPTWWSLGPVGCSHRIPFTPPRSPWWQQPRLCPLITRRLDPSKACNYACRRPRFIMRRIEFGMWVTADANQQPCFARRCAEPRSAMHRLFAPRRPWSYWISAVPPPFPQTLLK